MTPFISLIDTIITISTGCGCQQKEFSMTNRLRHYWHLLRESLWFIPGLMLIGSFLLAYGLVEFDANTYWQGQKEFPLLFGIGAEGSRGMLSAIAGSMLTVATLSFSLTLSTIAQVSSQYSPRVLRNFMRDQLNQLVMGYFVGVFSYCLIVLGTIRGTDEQKFVPATAVLVGLVLALGGVVALIFFIHHIAESMQSGTIVQSTTNETLEAIDNLFPSNVGESVGSPEEMKAVQQYIDEATGWHPVIAKRWGYLQHFDTDQLLNWATRHRVIVRIEQRLGNFIAQDDVLFSVRTDVTRPDVSKPDWPEDLLDYVDIGRHRSVEQDVSFGIQQLVDITLKALSSGINDPTTAIMGIDHLGAICERLAKRTFPERLRSDGQHFRVQTQPASFEDFIRLSFDLTRVNAKGDHAVLRRLLRALVLIGNHVNTKARLPVIREQIALLMDQADNTLATSYEKQQVWLLHQELKQEWF
jgi:uncharacterized membrane protein